MAPASTTSSTAASASCSARLGVVLDVPDGLLDPATGVTGVAPAYMAVIVEAWIDSAVHHGIPADLASPMVIESAAGALDLLRAREGETLGIRRAVTSPGGVTAAGSARSSARAFAGLRRCDGRRDGALPGMSALVIATTRGTIADYVYALFLVYSVIIVIYVLSSLVFSLGVRVPYSRWSDAVLGFLRDVCEPYLRIFRRFIPMIGPLDISPIVALIVLSLVGSVVEGLIRG